MKLKYEKLLNYQEYWKKSSNISPQQKDGLISLSDKFMHRIKENKDEMDGVKLLYPEDCSDFSLFTDFAFVMNAYVCTKDEGGFQMDGWFLNNEIEVE